MIVIAAVDDGGGMMFNHRRQSQDRILREHILEMSGGRLWMNQYSSGQFSGAEGLRVDDDFLEKAGDGEFCFVEDRPLSPCADRIERVILFKWNRNYPGDFHFDLDVAAPPWKLLEISEFPGFSHEKITKEVYGRDG